MSSVNILPSDNASFNLEAQQKKSQRVASLVLASVIMLHGALAWYILKAPKVEHNVPVVIMEVAMIQKFNSATKPAEPVAPPVKKEPVKPKPVVKPKPIKKPDVVKKPTPKPPEIKEAIPVPQVTPSVAVTSAPSTTTSSAATNTAEKTPKSIGRSSDSSQNVVSSVIPLFRVPPKYPSYAASQHIEGWVKVEFTVQTDGSVDDAVVVSSEPDDIFDAAALTAINKWEFKEKIVNGVAVTQRAVQKLQFKLEH